MTFPYYEIVTYKVANSQTADQARKTAHDLLSGFPGFIGWTFFTGAEDTKERVDLVRWKSLEEAKDAARIVGTSPEFAGFIASVASVSSMSHYVADTVQPPQAGEGVELGRFRLKPGVSEAEMYSAYKKMIGNHLTRHSGWRGQYLAKLDDGLFVDIAFASDRPNAETICASWAGQPDCEAFLALIEPEEMRFGTIL